MKILYVTTIGRTMNFFKNFIKKLVDEGNTVDLACNCSSSIDDLYKDLGCKIYDFPFSRVPFDKNNLVAYKKIKALVENNDYDIVHCHTPIAAMCTRLACRKARKNGTKVIYTAHGFHFYKGAPLKNWLMYYPVEKLCAKWTDTLITINREDLNLAKKKLKAKKIEYVPGVGIDIGHFANTVIDRAVKRKELGVPEDCFMLLSVGELNKNKNHEVVFRALATLNDEKLHYVVVGSGDLEDYLKNLAKELNLESRVHLLGRREDVAEIYKSADVYLLPSIREGLNVSVMEAMSSGLQCIVSNIRGNNDMVDETCGYLCDPFKASDFCEAIKNVLETNTDTMCSAAHERAAMFNVEEINQKVLEVYQ